MHGVLTQGFIMEAVRAYLRELRVGRQVSQDELADAIGLSRRALIEWEMGRTEDIKTGIVLRAIQHLSGVAGDLMELLDATVDRGVELARQRLAEPAVQFTDDQQRQLESLARSVQADQVDEVLRLLEELQRKNKTAEWVNFGRFLRG
jgi:transcriptional regulator with XRE-family HTH domain